MPYNGSLSLDWAASTESDLASYRLYARAASSTYESARTITTTALVATMSGLTNGLTWYFALTAVDQSGNESTYSAEVSKLVTVPMLHRLRRVA